MPSQAVRSIDSVAGQRLIGAGPGLNELQDPAKALAFAVQSGTHF
jgi:hypothetical protein